MPRLKPYTTNQESWLSILQKNLRIPMNQREYSWELTEITKFLDDIFKIYEEDKYVEKMGSIINLTYNNGNDIYDGQQRILTIILILNVISCLSEKLKNKINQILTIDIELDDFIRHLKKSHDYLPPDSSTKLHSSFIEIYNYFVLKKYDEKDLIDLYKFILNDIDVQYYDCNDPEYVSRIFDWENNRGKAVETLDIIKNPILVKIPNDKKVEIYDKWETLKHRKNNIYKKDFGQKIFDIAIQIYNHQIKRTINHEELYKPIIDNEDTYKEINKFFKIVEKLFEIMDEISEDRFGRLINNTPRICLNWEAYMWCLLPIFYKTNNIHTDLIKLMTKWYFRNLQFKSSNFNNLCYSNEFIKITNEALKNPDYDYYINIKECVVKNKDNSIKNDNYLLSMKDMNFKSTNATYLLLFLETCITTNLQQVSLEYTLEHIYCQKDRTKLCNPSLMDNIGNLTLIEGKNSDNGHKGNSSLGSKLYDKKVISYKGSSSMITRNIVDNYETFTEETIIERNNQIRKLLNIHTNY
jgi:hypothetical protein